MIVTILTIVYGTPMDHQTVVIVLSLNKKADHVDQDHVVETQTPDTINNATLHANADHHLLVRKRINNPRTNPLTNPRNKPVKPQVIAILLVIAHSMDALAVVHVSPGYKKVDHVVVIKNVILHVNVDFLVFVKNKNQTQDIFCILSNGNY
jgi:hypothetical protein